MKNYVQMFKIKSFSIVYDFTEVFYVQIGTKLDLNWLSRPNIYVFITLENKTICIHMVVKTL